MQRYMRRDFAAGRRIRPTLDLNFANADFSLDSRITFARSTIANRNSIAGTLTSTAIDVARANSNQDYNPSTLAARGFLIEAGATNQIRNPRAEGAVAGTPGTAPTNWSVTSTGDGVTREIVGTGTEDGIPYVDIKYSGTPSGTTSKAILSESTTQVVAAQNQTWTGAVYVRLVGGSLTNTTVSNLVVGRTAAGGVNEVTSATITPTSAAIRTQRAATTATMASGTTERVTQQLAVAYTSGNAIDLTLRIGAPQLEQNAFATSLILPPVASPAATARGADNASILSLPSIGYSQVQGFVEAWFMLKGVGGASNPRIVEFSDGTANNRITLAVFDGSDDKPKLQITTGGAQQCLIDTTVVATPLTLIKVAASWTTDIFRFACNGAAGPEDTSGTLPVVTQMQIGRQLTTSYLNGWIPKLQYGPQLLTSAQLASMTA